MILQEPGSTVPQSVLVVDDNDANRSLARHALLGEGYDVRVAASGEEALRMFSMRPAAAVLLDIRMPGLDGPTVCARMRTLPGGREATIIFLTAARDVATFDSAVRSGGDDFLTKPVQPDELLLRVAAGIKVRRLDAERRELFRMVQQQRDALLRLQLQKDQLVSFIVHDLLNPVNAIDIQTQVLQGEPDLGEEALEMLVNIRSSTRALTRMVLNLLDLSRADEGQLKLDLTDIEVDGLLEDLVAAFRLRAANRGVALLPRVDVSRVVADQGLLWRVLENLVENALRYAPRDSAIELRVSPLERGVEVRIRDRGAGVAEADRERVFERFAQLSSAGPRGNRGIGLAFCKHAIEAHGGTIRVEDAAPGAAFVITLPPLLATPGPDHGR